MIEPEECTDMVIRLRVRLEDIAGLTDESMVNSIGPMIGYDEDHMLQIQSGLCHINMQQRCWLLMALTGLCNDNKSSH